MAERHTISKGTPLEEEISEIPMIVRRDYPEISSELIRPSGGPIPKMAAYSIQAWNRLILLDQSPKLLAAEISGFDRANPEYRVHISDFRDRVIEALHAANRGHYKTANSLSLEIEKFLEKWDDHGGENPAEKHARLTVALIIREPFGYLNQVDIKWKDLVAFGDADKTPPEGVLMGKSGKKGSSISD